MNSPSPGGTQVLGSLRCLDLANAIRPYCACCLLRFGPTLLTGLWLQSNKMEDCSASWVGPLEINRLFIALVGLKDHVKWELWLPGAVKPVWAEPDSYIVHLTEDRVFCRTRRDINIDNSVSAGFGGDHQVANPVVPFLPVKISSRVVSPLRYRYHCRFLQPKLWDMWGPLVASRRELQALPVAGEPTAIQKFRLRLPQAVPHQKLRSLRAIHLQQTLFVRVQLALAVHI